MSQKVRLSNDALIEVEDTPFASGGEADVYQITSPNSYQQQVLKIYKLDKRTDSKKDKLEYLIGNKPTIVPFNGHYSVIWPTHLAFISNKFVGYTMPKASGSKLELLCHPKLPKILTNEWDKFSFDAPHSFELRLKLCFNIAVALTQIHAFGSYVLVDMKPDNIMVRPDGLISIIDIDSTEIIKGSSLLFPAQVATPEYTPPEFYKTIKNIETNVIPDSWDRFSLSVIFYRVLFGIHPFTASLKSPFEALTNVSDIIQKGFFPNGKNKEKFAVIPPPHKKFEKLENDIKVYFIKALEEGFDNICLRPSADDWCRVLSPDPRIKINRTLPSKAIVCFTPVYSKPVELTPLGFRPIRKPYYMFENDEQNFLVKLGRLLNLTEKSRLYHSIKKTQLQIDSQLEILKRENEQFNKEKSTLDEEQIRLLKKERLAIDKIVHLYNLKGQQIDQKAKELFNKEAEKYSNHLKISSKERNILEIKIKNEYQITVKTIQNSYENLKASLLGKLAKLSDNENLSIQSLDAEMQKKLGVIKNKIQKLEKDFADEVDSNSKLKLEQIDTKKKLLKYKETKLLKEALEKYQSTFTNNNLDQYKISDDMFSIFTDSHANPPRIVQNLASYKIITAADIKGVDGQGKILRSNGSWVKVPDVASARANCLNDWRRRKERLGPSSAPQFLPYSEEVKVKQSLAAELLKLDSDEKVVRLEALQKKNSIPQQLSAFLAEAKKEEQSLVLNIQTRKANIVLSSKSETSKVQSELDELTNNYNSAKILREQLFEKNALDFKNKIIKLVSDQEAYFLKIKNEYDMLHQQLILELKSLDFVFHQEIAKVKNEISVEINKIKSNYDSKLTQHNTKTKQVETISFEAINSLNSYQHQYNQNFASFK